MDRVRQILKEGVFYDYVEGELWQLVASIGKPSDLRRLLALFKKRSAKEDQSMPLKWGLLAFAAASARAGVYPRAASINRVMASDPFIQSLVTPFLDDHEYQRSGLISKLLKEPHPEPGLAIVTRLVERNLTHRSLGIRPNQLAPQVRNALQGIGMLAPGPAEKFDPVGDVLRSRFDIPYWRKWRSVFGPEYAHGLSMLLSADAKYASDPSEWLSWQDSFNDALFKALQKHLSRLALPGACPLTNTYGELIDYGALLDPNKVFSRDQPAIATPFRIAHVRRNRLPTSHPYEKKTAKQTTYLKARERKELTPQLAVAYGQIITLLDNHL
jgi:hypothetical protein